MKQVQRDGELDVTNRPVFKTDARYRYSFAEMFMNGFVDGQVSKKSYHDDLAVIQELLGKQKSQKDDLNLLA